MLAERWTFQCLRGSLASASTRESRAGARMSILIRSMYCYVRLLPGTFSLFLSSSPLSLLMHLPFPRSYLTFVAFYMALVGTNSLVFKLGEESLLAG